MNSATAHTASADEIHVWIRAATSDPEQSRVLSTAERERAERIVSVAKRAQFVTGRALARKVLGEMLGVDPQEVPIVRSESGKPALGGRSALNFSLSHSDEIVLLAVAHGVRMAVDVEMIRQSAPITALASRSFSAEERDLLSDAPERERRRTFYDIWTCKEAYMKANGRGIFSQMQQVSVDPRAGRVVRGVAGDSPERWRLEGLDVPSTHRASVCWDSSSADGRSFRVHTERG